MFGNNEYRTGRASALQYLKYVPLWLSIAGCLSVVFEFGFDASDQLSTQIRFIYNAVFLAGIASLFARYISRLRRPVLKVWFFDIVYLAVITSLLLQNANVHVHDLFEYPIWNYAMVFVVFIREFSTLKLTYDRRYLNPAQLFIAGFLIVIATGTALLLLPNSTHGGISLIDALFTSTSAVCVTGLIVEDTGSFFTPFGQTVILILIQIGGIGIMTFTSFFSHFFRGGVVL